MKLSLKFLSLTMAACASFYALSILIFEIPRIASWTIGKIDIYYLPHVAVLIGMIIFGIGLYKRQEQIPRLTKSLRRQAIGIVTMTLCAVLYNSFGNGIVQICGMAYCYWNPWFHFIIILWVAAWLLQFGLAKREDTYANSVLGVVGIIVSLAAALVLTFMFVSYVHVLVTEHVAGFQTTTWLSWLRPIALISLGGTMLLGDYNIIKEKGQTDNGIQEAQSYSKANQVIAKVSVSVIAVLSVLTIFSGIFGWFENTYWEECYFITVLGSIHMLWISSVIAMLLEKDLAGWHRTLNILAPILINGAIVLALLLEVYIPREVIYQLSRTLTEVVPTIGLILTIAFVIAVWFINTIIVLRTIARTKEKK